MGPEFGPGDLASEAKPRVPAGPGEITVPWLHLGACLLPPTQAPSHREPAVSQGGHFKGI